MPDRPPSKRHSWVKLRLHVYMCRSCGTGYENKEAAPGQWYRIYYKADGTNSIEMHVPPCAVGPRTPHALAKYADEL